MLDAITKGYISMHPAAAARSLARLDGRDIEAIFDAMPHPLVANVLAHMTPGSTSRCLAQLPAGTSSQILARTPVLTAVAALRLMKREQVPALLGSLPRPVSACGCVYQKRLSVPMETIVHSPSQSSSIVLTTVTDIAGFFSFLGIATLFSALI